MAAALLRRDVGMVYRILNGHGVTYRRIATIAEHSQSEVHEIVHGRAVRSYDVLVRIAEAFGVPRGRMGLASTPPAQGVRGEKVDEEVKRRQFFRLAAAAASGVALPAVEFEGADPPLEEVSRVGLNDVTMLDAMVSRLRVLDQEQGGQAANNATTALLRHALRLADADMTDYTRAKLLSFIAHTHSFVGWSISDAGMYSVARDHFQRSITAGHQAGDKAAVARTLHLAARNELIWSEKDHALKLFQFAQLTAESAGSNLLQATIKADASIVLAETGHTTLAKNYMSSATDLLGAVDFTRDPAPWFQASDVTSALSAARFHIGQQDQAIAEIADALDGTAQNRARSRAFRLANLAEFHLSAGDRTEGIEAGHTALQLASNVRSARLPVRLAPAAEAADHYRNIDARDLAHAIRDMNT
jgi:hypothetical protein